MMTVLQSTLYVLRHVQMLHFRQDADIPVERSEAYTLLYIAGGCGEFLADAGACPLDSGKLIHIAPGTGGIVRAVPGHYPLYGYMVLYERLPLAETSSAHRMFRKTGSISPSVAELDTGHLQRLGLHFHELEQLWSAGEQGRHMELEQVFRELICDLFAPRTARENVSGIQSVQQALDFIHRNYSDRISCSELAGELGLNAQYFSSLFKKVTGTGFAEYVNRYRVERAIDLLFPAALSLQEIAREVGYQDAFYFSRKFKEITGEAPSVFARRPKRIVALQHLGHLLALGVKPVGAAPTYLHQWGIAEQGLADIALIPEQFRPEEVAALRPDLIIAHQFVSSELIEQLKRIAKTVVFPYNQQNPFDLFGKLAELLGKQEEAERFKSRYFGKSKQAALALTDIVKPGETVAYYEYRPPYVWLLSENHGRGIYNLYHGLGLSAPVSLQQEVLRTGKPLRIQLDQLPDYAADHMFVGYYDPNGHTHPIAAIGTSEELASLPVWSDLPASRRKQLHLVDLRSFASSDVFSLYHQLDIQVGILRSNKNP